MAPAFPLPFLRLTIQVVEVAIPRVYDNEEAS